MNAICFLIYVHSLAFLWTYIQLSKKKLVNNCKNGLDLFCGSHEKAVECPSTLGWEVRKTK
jgi:hypothetical protein